MAKEQTSISLDKLIPLYGTTKAQADEYKKAADLQNKRIKEKMSKLLKKDETSTDYEADGWIATYQVRITKSFNEALLLKFAKTNKFLKSCVKTVEVVDEKELEDVLYKMANSSPGQAKKLLLQLDQFQVRKETTYLYIKNKKEEE